MTNFNLKYIKVIYFPYLSNSSAAAKASQVHYNTSQPKEIFATMELSGFTDMSYDFKYKRTTYFKNMIFIKFDNKVYMEFSGVNSIGVSAIMSYDEFMKNKNFKLYYELSLTAIGKPNLDENYYGSDDPDYIPKRNEKPYHGVYIDCIYIVEDELTKIKEVKKGNSYHSINLKKLKNKGVSSKKELEKFNETYNHLYGFEDETFKEREIIYPRLVSMMV